MVRLSHVSRGWNGRMVLDDVSMQICRGQTLLITGPNGGGKTTLLRILLGLLRPQSGTVEYLGPGGERLRGVADLDTGYLPQKAAIDSRFPITALEAVMTAFRRGGGKSHSVTLQALEALRRVGLEERADAPLGTLSGGQVQRVLLARAVAPHPHLLVVDEPLSYMDEDSQRQAVKILAEEAHRGAAVVIVTHEPELFSVMEGASRLEISLCQIRAACGKGCAPRY